MTFRRFLYSGLVLILIFCHNCAETRNENELFVDELMQEYDTNGTSIPGASVLVIYKDVPIIRRSYGFANIEEQTRVTSMTNFRLASLTKQFTAAAILLLAENKNRRLQLDDRIREKWLTALPEVTNSITIRHLLTHTSGLIDYEDLISSNLPSSDQLSDSDVLDILSRQNQTYFTPPGSRYRYSNSGYALLALIVEQASSMRFADFLRERIFLPLQMNETVAYEKGISTVTHRAFGYSAYNSSWIRTDQSQTSAVLGDGGIYSSIDDLAKWDAALYDDRLLSTESLQLAFTPAVRTDDPGIQYGMGWEITGDMVYHSGSTTGFRNIILRFPKRRLTVLLLTNRNYPTPYQTALAITHRLFLTTGCDSLNSASFLSAHLEKSTIYWSIVWLLFSVFYYGIV